MRPLVSVIIPTYNRAHFLGETLESIIAQTYSNWECIVVDDGSSDYTAELLDFYTARDSRIKFFERPLSLPKGANSCRNYGFEKSNGEYINWFDSDDIMHPHKLLIQVNDLIVNFHPFTVCQSLFFEKKVENILGLRSQKIISKNILYDYLTQSVVWFTPSPLWDRKYLKGKLLFDEELQAAQEWEFHCRILSTGIEFHTNNKPLVFLRKHSGSVTYGVKDEEREWNYFLARNKLYYNQEIEKYENVQFFLQKFLLLKFKKYCRDRNIKLAVKAFINYLLKDPSLGFMNKINSFLGMVSYLMFNKGDIFLKKVRHRSGNL